MEAGVQFLNASYAEHQDRGLAGRPAPPSPLSSSASLQDTNKQPEPAPYSQGW